MQTQTSLLTHATLPLGLDTSKKGLWGVKGGWRGSDPKKPGIKLH